MDTAESLLTKLKIIEIVAPDFVKSGTNKFVLQLGS